MTYLLVALHREGDEATELTAETARRIRIKHPTEFFWEGDHPDHEEIRRTRSSLPRRITGLCFGHGGRRSCSLRAQIAATPVWCVPEEFGALFAEARVYVFACEVVEDPADPNWFQMPSFGQRSILAGVQTFLGHSIPIHLGEAPPHWSEEQKVLLEETTDAVFSAFLKGESDQAVLRSVLLRGASFLDDLVAQDTDDESEGDVATSWGLPLLFLALARSLFVLQSPLKVGSLEEA